MIEVLENLGCMDQGFAKGFDFLNPTTNPRSKNSLKERKIIGGVGGVGQEAISH